MALTQARYDDLIDVPRAVWDPTEGRHSRHGERPLWAVRRVEVHWTGSGGDLLDHADTGDELLSFERFHEVSKGWYDLFYNVGLDSEEHTYEGRDITIPSQSDLRDALTLLVVVGPDQEDAIRGDLYNAFARGIYRAWGAVDPDRSQASLGYHGERSSTSCPGTQLAAIVNRLRNGWIPPGGNVTVPAHTHTYADLSPLQDAKDAKTKGLWDGSGPTEAASRSTVAVVANRVDNAARERDAGLAAQIATLRSEVAQLTSVGNTIEITPEALDAIVAELQRRLND